MDDISEDGFETEENYYAYLNISKSASADEINAAYRNLSRIYHPDKHIDAVKKKNAEILFNRIKKAYEVLSDPHKRAIYDSLGVKGLQTEGWEIVHRTKTPAEIREEFERLAREREERKLQQRTNPKGNITISVNATEIFNPYDDDFEDRSFPNIEVSGMSISQAIDAPITTRDTISMSGSLSSQNGNAQGGFLICGRRLVNQGWFEFVAGAGNGPVVGVKASRNLTNKVFCNGDFTLNFRKNGIIPGLVGTLAVQLDKHTVGYLTYNAGLQSSMSCVLERSTEKQHFLVTCSVGIPHSFISCSYTRKLIDYELKLRLAAKVGTFGYMAEYGAEKKVSKYSSVVASVSVGQPTGVIMKLKLIRSTQSYIFPIHLSEDIIPAAVFYATVTPLVAWFVVKKVIIEPMNAEQKQRDIDRIKETNKKRMAEKKREAEAAVDLMSVQYERNYSEEEKRNGLLIVSAIYGKIVDNSENSSDSTKNGNQTIDVKIPLQCLVKDSKLVLQESGKSELPGFYDPCVGEEKLLQIEYTYNGHNQSIKIKENELLRLPLSSS
ncbi:dnaJ homolog subfamily C member 11 [Sitodiplosis mosellana]|uniref:dnaJ homolog subfamily C member 11 n=1 Tax=Sitodiplosis mosellana TaxID=263140 RepID=UPI0024445EDE|nr:dnaJ homolog subfamily C member 11 [Sitodiplosis mosellana]